MPFPSFCVCFIHVLASLALHTLYTIYLMLCAVLDISYWYVSIMLPLGLVRTTRQEALAPSEQVL